MKISAIPPVSFRSKKNSQNIHSLIFSDNDTDGFIKSNKNIMIVNEQGDIVGKYHKNDFGHYAGFLVIRTTLNQNSDFLEELESVENSNCLIEKI